MKKHILTSIATSFFLLLVSDAMAADSPNLRTNNGGLIKLAADDDSIRNFEFKASSNVIIRGRSISNKYIIVGHHKKAVGKKMGRQFGMTSETTSIYHRTTASNTASCPDIDTGFLPAEGWYGL
ncbi:MAG: hypothetical protein CSB24_06875 [Deltaproteobacteria bacterium]|nr:MAG: hypothetical protein CSB24_06875 [Deltaproteobacteria bacterium]